MAKQNPMIKRPDGYVKCVRIDPDTQKTKFKFMAPLFVANAQMMKDGGWKVYEKELPVEVVNEGPDGYPLTKKELSSVIVPPAPKELASKERVSHETAKEANKVPESDIWNSAKNKFLNKKVKVKKKPGPKPGTKIAKKKVEPVTA